MIYFAAVFLGIVLAAASGIRAFLPLLLVGLLARFELLNGVELGDKFVWITSNLALTTFAVASIVEILSDKVPAVDSALDVVMTFIRPATGALSVIAVLSSVNPVFAYTSGLVLAAGTTLPIHLAKTGVRLGSHAATAGTASPVVSTSEDIAVVTGITISAFLPVLAIVFGLASLFAVALAIRILLNRRRAQNLSA